jgi:hypothetical protein
MPALIRILLWVAVVIAPGGVFLLPLLAADALRQRGKPATASAIETVR